MDFDFSTETITPTSSDSITINATGALVIPKGSTAQRPSSPTSGWIRYNTSLGALESFDGATWSASGGSVSSVNTVAPAAGFTITGGPITGTGSFTFTLANDLAALEGLSSTGFAARTAADTWAQRSLAAPAAGFTITNPAGVAGDPTFVLANDLAALEGLSSTGFAARTAADTWAQRSIAVTAGHLTISNPAGVAGDPTLSLPAVGSALTNFFGRVSTDAQGRVSGSSAAVAGDVTTALGYTPVNRAGDTLTGNLILNADPSVALGAATRQYVLASIDNAITARDPKDSVRVRTTTNINLASPGATLDAITMATGERFLASGQTTASQNGIYIFNGAASAATRSLDADANAEVTTGLSTFVSEGTSGGQTFSLITADPIVVGTTSLTFAQVGAQITYSGTNGITVSGAVISTTASSILRSLDGLATVGILAQSVAGTAVGRTLAGTSNQITISNGTGSAGDPTFAIAANAVLPGTDSVVVPVGTTGQEVGTTNGGIRYDSTLNRLRARVNGAWTNIGSGDVSSVALTLPSIFTVSGSPITTSGTLSATLASQTAATVFAAPAGSAGSPTFRSLVIGDLPIAIYRENPSSPTTPSATGANAIATGTGTVAAGIGSLADGQFSTARVGSSTVFAGGRFATTGDAQIGSYLLRNITTNATVTDLFLDGSATRLTLVDNQTMAFVITVVGRRTDATGGSGGYTFTGVIKRDVGVATTALVGTVSKVVIAETTAAWDAAVSADTTNGSLRITVTGVAANTIRWVSKVETTEVTN